MADIQELLNDISHRPWTLPKGSWQYYQEWNNALFLHWEVPFEALRTCVPERLQLDSLDGKYYVSLVLFTMEKIRPKRLPPVSAVSDFFEINLRTYIDNGSKKGVYFLNIEAEKFLSAFLAKSLSGLPYEKAEIDMVKAQKYASKNVKKNFRVHAEFTPGEPLAHKTELDKWLTERYCLYLDKGPNLYRYDIHHREWPVQQVDITKLDVNYTIGNLNLGERVPDVVHYSEGVQVLAWERETLL